jgi:hypothetical protein
MSDPSATPNFDSNSQDSRANSQAPPSNQQALAARSAATSRAKAANPPLILPSLHPGVAPVPRGTPAGNTSTPNSSQSAAAGDKKVVDVQALAALKKKCQYIIPMLNVITRD